MIKVFLADDHAIVRAGLNVFLSEQPDVEIVGEAGDGLELVTKVQSACPDIVIMDIAMPDQNGIEATYRVREACPSTQIVILSMYSSLEHVFRAFEAGAMGFVMKESAPTDLVKAIRTVSLGKHYLSPTLEVLISATGEDFFAPSLAKSPLERLSAREREVLQLTVEGRSSADIAVMLALSPKTVETYRSRTMQKLGLKDFPSLVKFAIQHGLTPP